LANLVYEAAKNIDQLENVLDEVKLVAHKHRGLGVKPEHYPIVGKYLLLAIKEVLGDDATDEIMNDWEEAYGVIAELFIDKVKESDVITSFYLKANDNEVVADYETGQYLTIRVKIPDEEYTQIRHYTISAAPGSDTYRISVKKETDFTPNGKVSTYLHDL